jgi:hypothetical protein
MRKAGSSDSRRSRANLGDVDELSFRLMISDNMMASSITTQSVDTILPKMRATSRHACCTDVQTLDVLQVLI